MDPRQIYERKRGTLSGALQMIRSNDVIATGVYGDEPQAFMRSLHTIAPSVKNVYLWTMLLMDRYPVLTDDSLKGHIDIITFFYNEDCRRAHQSGRVSLSPMDLHNVGAGIVATKRPTVFVAAVSPMDEAGNVYLSFELQAARECLDAADKVIFEVNSRIPRVCGETAVPITAADYLYEVDLPVPEGPTARETETSARIAEHVASLIHDGDCIQLGIGEIPNAVGKQLLDKQDLGVHSEMINNTIGQLIQHGAVTNARKSINRGKTVGAFAWGSKDLYRLIADNPAFELRRAAYVNDPAVIAQNDNMVSVNTALQIDLTGQVCSESIGSRQYSGTGGASDFAYGAFHAKNGRGILAFPSTAKGGQVSRIVAQLTPGSVVSISRNIVDCVVTEYGIARLRDRTVRQRLEALIAIAHPDFRAQLRQQADALML